MNWTVTSLQLVSKRSEADEEAGEMDEALINEAVAFMAFHQATKAADLRNGVFDLPPALRACS